ncbi:MAG TPA: phosphatase PAP2 family protein [Nitriliruptorales bacterium]|nr:phosphatase PAP2 family protein [Nitriliruptorales bacterium]
MVFTVAAAAVGASYVSMRSPALEKRERALAVRVRRPRGPLVDRVVSAATDLGSMFAVGGAAAVLVATGHRRSAADVLAAGTLAWASTQGIKVLVNRPRPYQVEEAERLIAEPAGSSWPSGHPAVVAAAVSALAPRLGPGGRLTGTVVATFVATSRVYVGVHYPTDVVAGLGIGGMCGAGWRLAAGRWRG